MTPLESQLLEQEAPTAVLKRIPVHLDTELKKKFSQEELDEYFPDLGIKVLPDNWKEGVPELIGFKPEWIDGVSMDG